MQGQCFIIASDSEVLNRKQPHFSKCLICLFWFLNAAWILSLELKRKTLGSNQTNFLIIDVFDAKSNSKIEAMFCHKLPPSLVPPAPLKARGWQQLNSATWMCRSFLFELVIAFATLWAPLILNQLTCCKNDEVEDCCYVWTDANYQLSRPCHVRGTCLSRWLSPSRIRLMVLPHTMPWGWW